jgi:long-chain acyl-CoA synthetase
VLLDFLTSVASAHRDAEAILWRDNACTYGELLDAMHAWQGRLEKERLPAGSVVALEADFSPDAVAALLALIEHRCIVVPVTKAAALRREELLETAEVEATISFVGTDEAAFGRCDRRASHPLYAQLRGQGHPGLVLFSSGSTGKSKAALHDFARILEKFHRPSRPWRAVAFLLFDHIGGINTMFHLLSSGGCLVVVEDRSPDAVLAAIARHRVELLPTSPTFLNLILLSEAYKRHDLSSLKRVTYGTEPMPESTLGRFHQLFPELELTQTYGLSELGILRAKSKASDSLWVKLGGEGCQIRVVEGILQIKSPWAMLGYLNAPSPMTADGWFVTGDVVQQDGEFLRIVGRRSEMINVGGEKVHPAEVESVIEELDGVAEATVYGERNPITGNIVCARVALKEAEDPKLAVRRVIEHCRQRLQRYKVPVKVTVAECLGPTERFKKRRLKELS